MEADHLWLLMSHNCTVPKAGKDFWVLPSWVLDISWAGDSKTSLGRLFQYFITLTIKLYSPVFEKDFLYFHLCPLHLVPSLSFIGRSLALSHLPSFSLLQSGTYTHNISSKLSHLHPQQSQCSQHISIIPISPLLDTFQCVSVCLEGHHKKESSTSEKNEKKTDL